VSFSGSVCAWLALSSCSKKIDNIHMVRRKRIHLKIALGRRVDSQVEGMIMNIKLLLCFATAILFVPSTALGQPKAPNKTDSTFVIKAGDANAGNLGANVRAGSSITFTLNIDRVVGATNSQGVLNAPSSLIMNEVIKEFATLKVAAFDIDRDNEDAPNCTPREFDEVLLNGQKIGKNGAPAYLNGKNARWRVTTFKVPISLLKFGIYVNGQWQGPGANQFEIKVSTLQPLTFPCGNDIITWTARVQWAAISFDALYPVLMIHGTQSNGASWDATRFTEPFRNAGIPYDNGDILKMEIPRIAKDIFHVKHVHVVAHSQGGLDTRDFLGRTIPKGDISVLTLTAFCTPNNGSPGADYAEDSVGASYWSSDSTVRTFAAQRQGTTRATPNLRVTYMTGTFNPSNILPDTLTVEGKTNAVKYSVIGADADINGNRSIESNESAGFVSPANNAIIAQRLYDLVGEVAYTRVDTLPGGTTVVREIRNPSFLLNDLIVSETSFQHPKFSFLGLRDFHHLTVRNPGTAAEAITIIKANNSIP
jgi:hypothetical protein